MPNTKSSIRRVKKTKIQTSINKKRKSKYKSAIKQMLGYIHQGKTKEANNFLSKFQSQLMKASKSGIIDKKTASRKISRITKKLNKKSK